MDPLDLLNDIKRALESHDKAALKRMKDDGLIEVVDGVVKPVGATKDAVHEGYRYWGQRSLAKKIQLNSLYGGLTNAGSAFFDQRMGQSITLTGRQIVRHMSCAINETLGYEYSHVGGGVIYGDTDSIISSTIIRTAYGSITVEDAFNKCDVRWVDGEKEYGGDAAMRVLSYDPTTNSAQFYPINYIYRHRTTKERWRLEDEHGNVVETTSDHSIMVEREGHLMSVKPSELHEDDILISAAKHMNIIKSYIKSVQYVGRFDGEYVYDIGIDAPDHHWFFGNNVLVHNSCYVTTVGAPILDGVKLDKDSLVELADSVAGRVNASFGQFMADQFNCNPEYSKSIKAGRELCSERIYFIKKKRYATIYFDKDGVRVDGPDKSGKLKIMGLETQRSDTPDYMQRFLKESLYAMLDGVDQATIVERVRLFRKELREKSPWLLGTPKKVNGYTAYAKQERKTPGSRLPGHVRAAYNYNALRGVFSDTHSLEATDGMKVLVCKLKPNTFDFSSIGLPVDTTRVPEWFTKLPFDIDEMEKVVFDKKLDNIFGALGWDFTDSKHSDDFLDLFDMV